MEKVSKELLRKAFQAGYDYCDDWHRGRGGDEPDFEEWFSNNSAQDESPSVQRNEAEMEFCQCPQLHAINRICTYCKKIVPVDKYERAK